MTIATQLRKKILHGHWVLQCQRKICGTPEETIQESDLRIMFMEI